MNPYKAKTLPFSYDIDRELLQILMLNSKRYMHIKMETED